MGFKTFCGRVFRLEGTIGVAICFFLHIMLIAIHVAVVYAGPSFFIMSHWHNGFLTELLALIHMGLDKVYLTLLLFCTQKLSLRRHLHAEHSLTAIHDQSEAWLGIGAALQAAWDQFSVAASPLFVYCILIYLIVLLGLGTSMPRMYDIAEANHRDPLFLNITSYLGQVGNNTKDLTKASPIVSVLPLLDRDIGTYGWQDQYIYDLPNILGSKNIKMSVRSVKIDVSCAALAPLQEGQFNTSTGTFAFSIDPQVEDVHFAPTNRALNVLPLYLRNTTVGAPATILVASTIPVFDDVQNTEYSVVNISPMVIPQECGQPVCTQISYLQILACDVTLENTTIAASGPFHTKPPAETGLPMTSWRHWSLPDPPKDLALSLMNRFGELTTKSNIPGLFQLAGSNFTGNYTYSTLEYALMEALGFTHNNVNEVTLGKLEVQLRTAVAAVLWKGALAHAVEAEPSNDFAHVDRYVLVLTQEPALFGLVLSCVASILVLYLTSPWSPPNTEVKNPGVLQYLWLAGKLPKDTSRETYQTVSNELDRMLGNSCPSLKNLREAGDQFSVERWPGSDRPLIIKFKKVESGTAAESGSLMRTLGTDVP